MDRVCTKLTGETMVEIAKLDPLLSARLLELGLSLLGSGRARSVAIIPPPLEVAQRRGAQSFREGGVYDGSLGFGVVLVELARGEKDELRWNEVHEADILRDTDS